MEESFPYHHYEIIEMQQSAIDADYTHRVTIGFHCPRCKTALPPLEHGDTTKCPDCGLRMQLHGNSLKCTA